MNKIIEEMFAETTVRKDGRRYYKGKRWYRILWDLKHPELPCKGFIIHHKDFNSINDEPLNLQRLTQGDHLRLHNLNMSDITRKKIEVARTGANNPKAKTVSINSQIFSTGKEAAEYLNVSPGTIRYRIKNNKPGYFYLNNHVTPMEIGKE